MNTSDPRTKHGMRTLISVVIAFLGSTSAFAGSRSAALDTTSGLKLHNVEARAVSHEGKRGVRIAASDEAKQRLHSQPDAQFESLAVIEGIDFANGVIEAEIAGAPAADAAEDARGFVGIAFRVHDDLATYDAFYLRPTNGRADDQVRRNHSAQYISHPEWPWFRLRKESPERYESYVDLVPGAWTRIRIEVHGTQARLFVHDQPQPTLIVGDLKTGADGRGAVALWINPDTVAHFRNLRVRALP